MRQTFAWITALCAAIALLGIARALRADDITGTLLVYPNITHTSSGASELKETVESLFTWSYSTNADDKITKMWVVTNTLSGNSSTNYDLYGSLTDSFGQSVSFDKVKFFAVTTTNGNFGAIGVGGASANAWSNWTFAAGSIVQINPGSVFLSASPTTNGYAVSNGASDVLSVTNLTASNAYYSIIIAGEGS